MNEQQMRDMNDLIDLLKKEAEADSDFGKDFDITINRLSALLVNNGYCLDFFISEKLQNEYAMSSRLIRIKQGNNGGYSMDYTHDGKIEVNLKIRLNGVYLQLITTLDEIEGIAVTKKDNPNQFAVRFIDLFSVTRTLHFEQFFWSPEKQKVIDAVLKPDVTNVVQLSSFRKR